MALVDYSITPHYKSDHHESKQIEQVVSYFKEHDTPYKALQDGDVIIVKK